MQTSESDVARYDIQAKAADPAATPAQMRLMMQKLLAERFKRVLHRDTREFPVYLLVPAKGGPKIHESSGNGEVEMHGDRMVVTFNRMSMTAFADFLSGPLHRPVVNRTGLTGAYDLTIDVGEFLSPGSSRSDELDAVFPAIEQQLGLKLTFSKASLEIVIVDRAERRPTEN